MSHLDVILRSPQIIQAACSSP